MRLHRRLVIVLGIACFSLGAPAPAQEKSGPATPAIVLDGRTAFPGLLAPASPRRNPIVVAAERARAAVVNIHSERLERTAATPLTDGLTPAPAPRPVNGMGTGIVIDPRGYIVTNHH